MSDELKPCPFCGGGAHVKEVVSACEKLYTVGCSNSECMGFETLYAKPTVDEALAAWNRRAERTCRDLGGEEGTVCEGYDFACSACGFCCDVPQPSYCPNCGAKVIGEES